jgi:hypothetical protein
MVLRFRIVVSAPALPFNMLRSNTNLAVRESISMLRNLQVTHFGGNANNGTNAGGFLWNLNNDSSNSNRNIGTHHVSQSLKKCDGGFPVLLDEYIATHIELSNEVTSRVNRLGGEAR